MPEKNLTLEQTARYLEVSSRSVRSYIRKGLLMPFLLPGSRKKWLSAAEVHDLKEALQNTERPRNLLEEVALLRAKVMRLESKVEVLEQILDAKDAPLGIDEETGKHLYHHCVQALHGANWNEEEIENWAELFMRLTEEDFSVIALATGDRKPWAVFLKLSVRLLVYAEQAAKALPTTEAEAVHTRLAEGRRRLRVAAVIYAESSGLSDEDLHRYGHAQIPASVSELLSLMGKAKRR